MARGSGDIVYEIGGTADSLIAAATSGGKSLRAMERDAKALQTQIDRMGKVQADYQRALNQTIGVQDRVAKSAKASAQVFREWESASKQVNALRASIDPLYAASQRYEQALETLDAAVQKGIISQAEHTRMVDLAGKAFLTAGGQADQSASQIGGFAGVMARNRASVQMFSYQIQDVAVQLAAGTRATTVFAQQGSQMLGALGPYGAIAGAALAVTLPLAGALFSAADGAKAFEQAFGDVTNSLAALRAAADNFTADGIADLAEKYGEVNVELMRFLDLQAQAAQVEAINRTRDAMGALADEMADWWSGEAWSGLQGVFDLTVRQANDMAVALRNAQDAASFEEQLASVSELSRLILEATGGIEGMSREQFAFFQKVRESEDALRQLVAVAPKADWLSGMIGQASVLAGKLWDAVTAKVALSDATPTEDDERGSQRLEARSAGEYRRDAAISGRNRSSAGSGGGGGGGGVDQLEALKQTLMTEAEVEMAAYAERQAMLEKSLEAKRLTLEEYNRLYEQMQSDHQAKMTEIDVYRYGDGLAKAQAFFGEMASAMQGGTDAMARIARAFGAIEALINAWRAYNQVLAAPDLPWFAKLPKAAAVLAAGMGAVNAIKGGGSSAKPSASTGAATAAAQSPAMVNIQWMGAMTADSMGSLTKKLNAEYKQGYRLNFVAA